MHRKVIPIKNTIIPTRKDELKKCHSESLCLVVFSNTKRDEGNLQRRQPLGLCRMLLAMKFDRTFAAQLFLMQVFCCYIYLFKVRTNIHQSQMIRR